MFKNIYWLAAIVLFACNSPKTEPTISISNPLDIERNDELVVIKRDDLVVKMGAIANDKYVTLSVKGQPVVAQYDDLNGDGIWDEVSLLVSLKAKETKQLALSIADAPATIKAVVRAHVRQKRKNSDDSFGDDLKKDSIPAGQAATDFTKQKLPPFLTEGPAWENDKVGFRIYFDVRNAKDIWGKTSSRMVLDEVGVNPDENYHAIADWGMDVLKVGTSLGAGGLALKYNEGGKDTIVRLGGLNMGPVQYEKVADGPVRAIFKLHYPQWLIGEGKTPVSLTEEISIWGGQYFTQSTVVMNHVPAGASLLTGIVNLKTQKPAVEEKTDTNRYIYTYDEQSENHDKLGMAILLPAKEDCTTGATANENTDVTHTYYVAIPASDGKALSFRFLAGWERSETFFSSEDGFSDYVKKQSQFYTQPLIVK